MTAITSSSLTISNLLSLLGNLGIGTTSPWGKLSIAGLSSNTAPLFTISTTTSGNATSTAFIVDANGKVGIGTTSPAYKLDIYGGDASINGIRVGLGAGSVVTNVVLGSNALISNTTGGANTAIGDYALASNTSGGWNTAVGKYALRDGNDPLARNNVGVGYAAGVHNLSGAVNTYVGYQAGHNNTVTDNSTAMGYNALYNSTSQGNTAIGSTAGFANVTGFYNTFLGYDTGTNVGQATNLAGSTANGVSAWTTANYQMAFGVASNNYIFRGTGNTSFTGNVGIGTTSPWAKFSISALSSNTTPLFIISTSTASATSTAFLIDQNGQVGIASSSP